MSFEIKNAAEFIPQRTPFVLVDRLLYVDEHSSRGSYTIPKDHFFVKQGYFSTSGMVEAMAQTAAAGTGYLTKKENRPVAIGYIGAVQKLEVFDWAPAEAEIIMEITLVTTILQVSLVTGIVRYDGNVLATCEMKIFITNPS